MDLEKITLTPGWPGACCGAVEPAAGVDWAEEAVMPRTSDAAMPAQNNFMNPDLSVSLVWTRQRKWGELRTQRRFQPHGRHGGAGGLLHTAPRRRRQRH